MVMFLKGVSNNFVIGVRVILERESWINLVNNIII